MSKHFGLLHFVDDDGPIPANYLGLAVIRAGGHGGLVDLGLVLFAVGRISREFRTNYDKCVVVARPRYWFALWLRARSPRCYCYGVVPNTEAQAS